MRTVHYRKERVLQAVPGTTIRRPMLRVRLSYADKQTPEFLALLDSGADLSVFHVDLATFLGINLANCPSSQTTGIGGLVTVHTCTLQIEVEGVKFKSDVQFSAGIDPTVALLGRDNVFDKFRFGFDQRNNRLMFDY